MPELPDITIYVEALRSRVVGRKLLAARALSPFVLRTVSPSLSEFLGQECVGVSSVGKRIALEFSGSLFVVFHLMIAGRLLWKEDEPLGRRPAGKMGLAMFAFENGHLLMTEASTKKRASISTAVSMDAFDMGGALPLEVSLEEFGAILRRENRTLKRALTDPSWFSGIGNAYSDEILHAARLSPLKQTRTLNDELIAALHKATVEVLADWTERLRKQFGDKFPGQGQITAFRPEFAVHGKYGKPCPDCGKPVQRIRYAENETNYCAQCQNEGRILADRSLSRLLKDDWPRNIDELD